MTSLSKSTVLTLACLFRQAERSVHFALSSPSQWAEFASYYDDAKRERIAKAIALLESRNAVQFHDSSLGFKSKSAIVGIFFLLFVVDFESVQEILGVLRPGYFDF